MSSWWQSGNGELEQAHSFIRKRWRLISCQGWDEIDGGLGNGAGGVSTAAPVSENSRTVLSTFFVMNTLVYSSLSIFDEDLRDN